MATEPVELLTGSGLPEVETEPKVTDESIEQSLSTQYAETALVLRASVAMVKIESDDEYQVVCLKVKEAQSNIKAIEAQLEPFRKARYESLQRIYDISKRLVAPLEDIKKRGSRLIAQYQIAQEQKRKAAEEEERKRQLELAQKQQEQEAETLFAEGREAEAVALLETQPTVVPVVAPATVAKVAGISKARERYKADVVDFPALVKAVAEGKVPILALLPDQKWLDGQAEQMKKLLQYPGVRLKKEVGLASVRGNK